MPGGFQPHSDLEVTLTGTCSATGVVDTLNHPDARIVELESALVSGIDVTLGDESVAMVTLTWEAGGEIIKWRDHAPGMHARHETKFAELTGAVVITGPTTLTVNEGDVSAGPGELDGPRITHCDEVDLRP